MGEFPTRPVCTHPSRPPMTGRGEEGGGEGGGRGVVIQRAMGRYLKVLSREIVVLWFGWCF